MKLNRLFIGTLVVFTFLFMGTASAGTLWDEFDNSILSGYIANGGAINVIENITVYEPVDEELFGVPLKFARYKVLLGDGKNVIDDLLLVGEIGDSDTFYLSYRKLDEPFDVDAVGVLYNATQHWDEDLPPVYIGVYLMEPGQVGMVDENGYAVYSDGGNPVGKGDDGYTLIDVKDAPRMFTRTASILYTLYGEYEIATGYFIGADILLGMETIFNRDFLDGKIWGKHNFKPDGSTYGEIFAYNIAGNTYVGGGIGYSF